jgi:hypothetical protein
VPPDGNPGGEQRGDESTENSPDPETAFAERVTNYRPECTTCPTERASNQDRTKRFIEPVPRTPASNAA